MSSPPRVLIVDASAESRDVLRTLLELRGALAIEARHPDQAAELTDRHRPHLIVFDAESDRSDSGAGTDALRAAADRFDTPVVILGSFSRQRGPFPGGQFVAKPYQYGALIRKIEGLLAAA